MSLHRVQIYYYACPTIQSNLAEFRPTAAMSSGYKKVEGRCVDNAHLIDTRQKPIAHCTLRGKWVPVNDECKCRDGYYQLDHGNNIASCSQCLAETYRANQMKSCAACPKNRESLAGAGACRCTIGYRELPDSSIAKPCYKPAMQTKQLDVETAPSSVEFVLRAPTEDEKERLRYLITVCEQTVPGAEEPFECIWNDKEIRYSKLERGMSSIKVQNLNPLTQYEITVKSVNIVTRPDDENTITFTVTTPQQLPDKVLGLRVVQKNPKIVHVEWEAPQNGNVVKYNIKYKSSEESVKTINVTETATNITDIEPGTEYAFYVCAVNQAGSGPYAESRIAVPLTDDVPITILLVAAASGILIVISVIVCAYCCCCRSVPRKKIPPSGK